MYWAKKPGRRFSTRSVTSDSLQPHGLQQARRSCPSSSPWVHPNSCPLSQWCHPTISPLLLLPSISPSIRVFSSESALWIWWPKYWRFNFSISPSNEYSGLISFRIDWFDLLESKGLSRVFSSTIQKHRFFSAQPFFMVQLSHLYMNIGKTIPLPICSFASREMSLRFNMLSRFVRAFLPRIRSLLISWLQSPSVVILEPKKIVSHCFHCLPTYLPWSDGTRCHDLSFRHVEF